MSARRAALPMLAALALGVLALASPAGAKDASKQPKPGDEMPIFAFGEMGQRQGRIERNGEDHTYRPFHSRITVRGKVSIMVYMAGHPLGESRGLPMLQLLTASDLDHQAFVPVVVVDLDDCIFGTCGFVQRSIEELPRPVLYAIDESGVGREALGLPKRSFSAFLIDAEGVVRRVQYGRFSKADAEAFMAEARLLVAQGSTPKR